MIQELDRSFVPCAVKTLPTDLAVLAAETADKENPANKPSVQGLAALGMSLSPDHLAVMRAKKWASTGVRLTVAFMENLSQALKDRILLHANEWDRWCNVQFVLSNDVQSADVRITTLQAGYWSYLGTDIKHIPRNEPTMCLQSFSMAVSEREFRRVVTHEFGHTLGFPHEHMRRSIIERLDINKTIAYFQQTQGWSASTTRSQVLTPIEEGALLGTPVADETSIMAYSLPASITLDGRAIVGGADLSESDRKFSAEIYPEVVIPKPPVEPPITAAAIDVYQSIDPVNKVWSIRLPPGWTVKKLGGAGGSTVYQDDALFAEAIADLESALPAAAPGAGPFSDIYVAVTELVAALKAKDYWAAYDAITKLIAVLRDKGGDGGISFSPQAALGINWGKILEVVKIILPLIIDQLSK